MPTPPGNKIKNQENKSVMVRCAIKGQTRHKPSQIGQLPAQYFTAYLNMQSVNRSKLLQFFISMVQSATLCESIYYMSPFGQNNVNKNTSLDVILGLTFD